MPRFPALLDVPRNALFEIVEAFRIYKMEGRAVTILPRYLDDPGLRLIMDDRSEPNFIDTDLDTLRVLDEAGYVAFTETPRRRKNGSERTYRTLTLKRLASDYYDWCHAAPWYKPVAERWFSLAPDTGSAIVGGVSGAVTSFVLALLVLLIQACLSQ